MGMDPAVTQAEWIETDGAGGFASGTVGGVRTRRYHALLLSAVTPPTGRVVLVNGFEAWVETPGDRYALTTQHYAPDVFHPDGKDRIAAFSREPWPTWSFRIADIADGAEIRQELTLARDAPETLMRWRKIGGKDSCRLVVRLLFSGRDYHSLHHENRAFRFEPAYTDSALKWTPYPGVPATSVLTNGRYYHEPAWYRSFLYEEERQRGLDCVEDLASPGWFAFDLDDGEAVMSLSAGDRGARVPVDETVRVYLNRAFEREKGRRQGFESALERAADSYIVRRGRGKTVIAGYPWFTDWGRDTFVAMRGLCLATGRFEDAEGILLAWADAVSEGMLPNYFADQGSAPEYNTADASLWYVVAVHDYLAAANAGASTRRKLQKAVESILEGHAAGTRYGVRADDDGLLRAGAPGVQLTWMDAKIGDWVVTPRSGKPVELQALWLNALRIASAFSPRWQPLYRKGASSFRTRFWRGDAGCLYDVVDADHVPGRSDATFRPNQIFAVGGLPYALLEGACARAVVKAVEQRLWTPLGLRTLAPDEPGYRPRYEGGPQERDSGYHQGTVWPWLLGPFVEAWLRVHPQTPQARQEAAQRFVAPLLAHLETAGLGHVSELADADPPHTPRGCPFQAWSLGELIRINRMLEAAVQSVDPPILIPK